MVITKSKNYSVGGQTIIRFSIGQHSRAQERRARAARSMHRSSGCLTRRGATLVIDNQLLLKYDLLRI